MMFSLVQESIQYSLIAAAALFISHTVCVAIIFYHDLVTKKWQPYAINSQRNVTADDYIEGMKSFIVDILLLFIPCMTFCFGYSLEEITQANDSIIMSFTKLGSGYVLGKLWAFAVHYILHFPMFYKFHRRHHLNPRKLVASAAWMDSKVEYSIMELPSFAITVLVFPTHFYIHVLHFIVHGWDGAAGHSGFKSPPGNLGALFDGEYHYYHHAHLTLNYAEIEFLDKIFGTHHSQNKKMIEKYEKKANLQQENYHENVNRKSFNENALSKEQCYIQMERNQTSKHIISQKYFRTVGPATE